MQFTAKDIALMLKGTVEGDPLAAVNQLAKIEEAEKGTLSFLANPKYEQYLYTTKASIVIVNQNQQLSGAVNSTLIRVENAYSAFTVLLEAYNTFKLQKSGIEQPSFIHASAKMGDDVYLGAFSYISQNVNIGKNCKIYPNCYIADGVTLGDNVTLFPGVTIYFDCIIGSNVTIHSGAVIGSDGFGFAPNADGTYSKIAQIGNVIIEDNVEIGSNATVDRATMGSTIIRKGAKIDNLVQIAHNVEVGSHTVIAAQSGISGSSKIGERVMMGGQVGIAGHLTIADGSQFGAQSGINSSVKEANKKWGGSPYQSYQDYLKGHVNVRRLPDLEKRVKELETIIKEFTKNVQ